MPAFLRSCVLCGALVGLIVTSCTTARANSLPSALSFQTFTPAGVIYSGPPVGLYVGLPIVHNGSFTQTPNNGTLGYTVMVNGGSDPATSVQFGVSGAFGSGVLDQFDLRSTLTYYFEVSGPANQTAEINLSGTGGASVNGPSVSTFGSESMIGLASQSSPSNFLVEEIAGAGDTSHLAYHPNTGSSLSLNTDVDVETNTVYVVTLFSEAYFGTTGSYSGLNAFAIADPSITLVSTDPGLSLEFSPGLVPDSSPVPEPGTLSLLTAGIAAIGLRVRAVRLRRC